MALIQALLTGCPQLLDDDFGSPGQDVRGLPEDAGRFPDSGFALNGHDVGNDASTARAEAGAIWTGRDAGEHRDGSSVDAAAAPVDASKEPDADGGEESPVARALREALVHRYRFDPGATLLDSVGDANAISVGVTFSDGAAVFAGTGGGQYLDLPNDLLSGLTNVSIEAWVIWDVTDPLLTTSQWQRIFDFGSNSNGTEGGQGDSANGIFLTPKSGGTQGKLHFAYRNGNNTNLDAPDAMPYGVVVQVVAVVDDDGGLMRLYRDGALVGALSATLDLPSVVYRNNWLGRSQYLDDPPFRGKILDFRIYASALESTSIQASFAAGADVDW